MRVLSICCGMGLLDRAFMDEGFEVVPGCEVDPDQRELHAQLCGGEPLHHTLDELIGALREDPQPFDGVIGGPPCQSHTRLRAMRDPKYPDLTAAVNELIALVCPRWFLFENVCPLKVVAKKTRIDAMHYYQPHQSRARWFTHSPEIEPPYPLYQGNVDALMAYPVVAGRIYGKKRAAVLQGYPAAARLKGRPLQIVYGLANAVPYPVGRAWARSVRDYLNGSTASHYLPL